MGCGGSRRVGDGGRRRLLAAAQWQHSQRHQSLQVAAA